MSENLTLPYNYHELFLDSEDALRDAHEGAYFSKFVIYEQHGRGVAVAPWGNPGWTTPVIFPYAHYISVTHVDRGTSVYHFSDMLGFLQERYEVTECTDEQPAYILVNLPDFLEDEQAESDFWTALDRVPTPG